jgi:hypothetical protein
VFLFELRPDIMNCFRAHTIGCCKDSPLGLRLGGEGYGLEEKGICTNNLPDFMTSRQSESFFISKTHVVYDKVLMVWLLGNYPMVLFMR